MKHINHSFWLILFLISFSLNSQAQDLKVSHSLKAYTNVQSYTERGIQWIDSTPMPFSSRYNSFGSISFAYNIKNELGQFHEFELSQLYYRHKDEVTHAWNDSIFMPMQGVRSNSFGIALRYERGWQVFRHRATGPWSFYFSAAAQPFYRSENTFPANTLSFPTKEWSLGGNLFAIPRVQLNLNSKWSMDLNFPIQLATAEYGNETVENPAFTSTQQRFNTFSFQSFPNIFNARLGIGYTFK